MSRWKNTSEELVMWMLRYCTDTDKKVRNELINDYTEYKSECYEDEEDWSKENFREYLNEMCDELHSVTDIDLNFKVI